MLCRHSILLIFLLHLVSCEDYISGHLKPLGYHQPPEGSVPSQKQLKPMVFYEQFLLKNKPVLIENVLSTSTPFLLWSDDYMNNKFANEIVNVDFQKYEDRSGLSQQMKLEKFLRLYNGSDTMYLISTMTHKMQSEFPLPFSLHCTQITDRMQDYVLWFSSGNTNSLLHYDNVENMYCQMDGTKKWILIDPYNGSNHIIMDHPEGHYCSVNVSSVDMFKYPGLKNVPWWNVTTTPGSCLYVPNNWWHQVRSFNGRNMAVNIWWAPLIKGIADDDTLQCQKIQNNQTLANISFSPGKWIKWSLITYLNENSGKVSFAKMMKNVVHEHTGYPLLTKAAFDSLDLNDDGELETNELVQLPPELIHAALQHIEIGALNTNGIGLSTGYETIIQDEL